MTDYSELDLDPHHAEVLANSAISPDVAAQRGYRTLRHDVEARGLGFAATQCRVPALLLPMRDVHGDIANFQIRPDQPRLGDNGKPLKYESRMGSNMTIDVPAAVRGSLLNPSIELWVTEGVKKADAAVSAGLVCIGLSGVWAWRGTNEHGGKVALPDWESIALNGRNVYIAYDSDVTEKRLVRLALDRLCAFLASRGAIAHIAHIPPGENFEKQGLDDYLAGGGTIEALRTHATQPSPMKTPTAERAQKPWPVPPGVAVYRGLAGDFVRAILPHTESDPIALLISFLVAFGSAARVGATRHGVNLFAVLAGSSSKARKGDSWQPVAEVFKLADPDWMLRLQNGISSGEGLIDAVRDGFGQEPSEENSRKKTPVDAGVSDKRLMVVEPEFARVLKVMDRQGNIVSSIIRDAWDGRDLQTLTKSSPLRATSPHFAILGHVTGEELRETLHLTDIANGFANRFVFALVARSKLLPNPEPLDAAALTPLAQKIAKALAFARVTRLIVRDEDASKLWADMYSDLSAERYGLLGSLTARSEAHVLRLSLLFALLDESTVVTKDHLLAAVELWAYSEQSLEYLFGDSTGDPIQERILEALADHDLTRTEIRDLFGRNKRAELIDRALRRLEGDGVIIAEEIATGGRTARRWSIAE